MMRPFVVRGEVGQRRCEGARSQADQVPGRNKKGERGIRNNFKAAHLVSDIHLVGEREEGKKTSPQAR